MFNNFDAKHKGNDIYPPVLIKISKLFDLRYLYDFNIEKQNFIKLNILIKNFVNNFRYIY